MQTGKGSQADIVASVVIEPEVDPIAILEEQLVKFKPKQPLNRDKLKVKMQELDVNWYVNGHKNPSDKNNYWIPFPNIEAQTIQRHKIIYDQNGGVEEDRYVNIGNGYIIDLKLMIRYMINDPGFDPAPQVEEIKIEPKSPSKAKSPSRKKSPLKNKSPIKKKEEPKEVVKLIEVEDNGESLKIFKDDYKIAEPKYKVYSPRLPTERIFEGNINVVHPVQRSIKLPNINEISKEKISLKGLRVKMDQRKIKQGGSHRRVQRSNLSNPRFLSEIFKDDLRDPLEHGICDNFLALTWMQRNKSRNFPSPN